MRHRFALCLVAAFLSLRAMAVNAGVAGKGPPPLPVGYDAYRLWSEWPLQRIGMRAYMISTYDRSGENEGGDASHFLYQLSDQFNVTLDLEGAGSLVFARFNHWHGSPWHFVVDGVDNIVGESSTADPAHPVPGSTFLPSSSFPSPLNETWSTTKGSDLIWTPISFQHSFQMAYSRTHYGTGYYIYDRFVPDAVLTSSLQDWNESMIPPADVLNLLSRSGTDILPDGGKEMDGRTDIPATGQVTVANVRGRSIIRGLSFSVPEDEAARFENVRLQITWDGRKEPSVNAPVALFFGAGTLFNRDGHEYLVKAFPVNIRFAKGRISLTCYFPMPLFRSARIALIGAGKAVTGVRWNIRSFPMRESPDYLAYFHATYRDIPNPPLGRDMVLLDTRGIEGSEVWSGSFIGTSFTFSHNAFLPTLEGDPRFFFDDSLTPQAQGTGTEEWAGGGDYWGGLNMTLPFVGHPVGAPDLRSARNEEDKIESAYRFLLADLMPFGKNAVICLEHGGMDESTEHYETVTYWYGAPAASLVETDQLEVGNLASERSHRYASPQASAPYKLTSRYELGVDTLKGKTIFLPQTDLGRFTEGTSEFKLRIRPDNLGVLLRRKLDYSFANQRAEVFIASKTRSHWKSAGIWYLAGSNSSVYSNPDNELGPTQHIVETSNRRFREDEFLIARQLTAGKRSIWIRIVFKPVNRPITPKTLLGKQGWSEMKYMAYCFVKPRWKE